MELDKELLNILACPRCKGGIELSADRDGLVCEKCGLRYPIKDGIPVLLVDEAVKTGG
ncbi:MAG: Trm112 family protein [Thermodesulfobacteriota bacterium]